MNDDHKDSLNNGDNITKNIYTERIKQRKNAAYYGSARKIDATEDKYASSDAAENCDTDNRYQDYNHPAKRLIRKRERNRAKEILGWVLSIGIAISAAFLIRAFVFEIILVDGDSMFPTLFTNERVAIEKLTRYGGMPERGDIIIVKYPNMDGTFVKRAMGLPGETIEIKDSVVYIDGEPIAEDYINPEPYADMDAFTVPEDHVFVMGDNRAHSLDSRAEYIGPIPHSDIVGHGLFVIWPLTNMHPV